MVWTNVQFGCGQHRNDTGHGDCITGVHTQQAGVSHLGTHEHQVQRTVELEVVDKPSSAQQ